MIKVILLHNMDVLYFEFNCRINLILQLFLLLKLFSNKSALHILGLPYTFGDYVCSIIII
jgi:hypothetical protein